MCVLFKSPEYFYQSKGVKTDALIYSEKLQLFTATLAMLSHLARVSRY